MVVACSGDETTPTAASPCAVDATELGLNDPVLEGQTTADLLAAYALEQTVMPVWWDDAPRELTVAFAALPEAVVLRVDVSGDAPECQNAPLDLVVPMTVTVSTPDGWLNEVVEFDARIPAVGLEVRDLLTRPDIMGSIDLEALIVAELELDYSRFELEVLATVDDEGVHQGALTALGFADEAVTGAGTRNGATTSVVLAQW